MKTISVSNKDGSNKRELEMRESNVDKSINVQLSPNPVATLNPEGLEPSISSLATSSVPNYSGSPLATEAGTIEVHGNLVSDAAGKEDKILAPSIVLRDSPAVAHSKKEGADKRTSKEKEGMKSDPQTFAEYVDFFYKGKIKSLPEKFIQRLTGSSEVMAPEMRSALQQKAIDTDTTLEKTRQLMQLARSARSNHALEFMFREFARDVVVLHPAVRREGFARSFLFPGSEEETSLQDVWDVLNKGNSEGKSSKSKTDKSDVTPEQVSMASEKAKSNFSKDFAKARRNAFFCSVLWRQGQESTTFGDILRVLRETTLCLKRKPANMEGELLESLLSLSSSESEKVGLYAEWAGQLLHAQVKRSGVLEEQLTNKAKEVERLTGDAIEQATVLALKVQELEILEKALVEAQSELTVQKVHTRADYEELRARSLGVLKKEVADLENVEIALSRPIPKVETAKDVVKVVVDSLQAYINDLEGKR